MNGSYSQLWAFGIYDFSITGGRLGVQPLGCQIPVGCPIYLVNILITTFVSSGLTTVFIGSVSSTGVFNDLIGGFNTPIAAGSYFSQLFPPSGVVMDNNLNMAIQITGAPITAGRFVVQFGFFYPPA